MKKLLPFVAALTLLFSGCTEVKKPELIEVNRNFRAQATITHNSAAYTADFESNENGCSAAFVYPEEIKGLIISFDGSSFTYRLDDLSFTSPPQKEMAQFLPLIYSALSDRSAAITHKETHYSVQGKAINTQFYMNINESFFPTYLEIEDADLSVRFENLQPNEQITE